MTQANLHPLRHYVLLGLIGALLVASFAGAGGGQTRAFIELVFVAIVVVLVHDARDRPRLLAVAAVHGGAVVLLRLFSFGFGGDALSIAALAASVSFFALGAFVLLDEVVRATDVTGNTIAAALCVYLVFGILWGFGYVAIEIAAPGAFSLPAIATTPGALLEVLLYFSFVTLTTLGFGDVAPVAPTARIVVALEAIIGQFYVAVLVARLVGIHASRRGCSHD